MKPYVPPGPVAVPGTSPADMIPLLTTELAPEPQAGLVKTWSYSTLKKFESCSYSVYLAKVAKIPTEQGDAAARGEKIHLEGEQYIKGELAESPPAFGKYKLELEGLRKGFEEGRVYAEDEWGFSPNYDLVGWKDPNVWLRMKLDCLELIDDKNARVIDFKTGRKFGNEMSHGQQLQLYAIATLLVHPTVQFVQAQAWYLDQNEPPLEQTYTRKEALSFQHRWTMRALALTTATNFPPRPTRSNCRFCDFKKNGACEWATEV